MTTNDKIRDEKLQHNTNREAVKLSALSSGKIDKHECLRGEEILTSDQRKLIEQANFTYFPLHTVLEKQTKTMSIKPKSK